MCIFVAGHFYIYWIACGRFTVRDYFLRWRKHKYRNEHETEETEIIIVKIFNANDGKNVDNQCFCFLKPTQHSTHHSNRCNRQIHIVTTKRFSNSLCFSFFRYVRPSRLIVFFFHSISLTKQVTNGALHALNSFQTFEWRKRRPNSKNNVYFGASFQFRDWNWKIKH